MRKSGIILALLTLCALMGVLVIAGCRQEPTASPEVAKTIFPNGTATTQVPATAIPKDTSPAPAANKTPEPVKPPTPEPPKPAASTGKYSAPTQAEVDAAKKAGTRKAIINTAKGTITAELYGDKAPLTVANFVKLAKAKFYDGLTFHRVENKDPKFALIQGGDPAGNGTGGPGYSIKLEIAKDLKHVEGALAMARSQDPDSAGSQFYITNVAIPQLDGQYAVFGKVTQNLDVSKKIAVGDKIISITIE